MAKLVTEDKFYEVIFPLDVVLQTEGNYPYKTTFRLRHGGVVGWQDSGGRYFLNEEYLKKGAVR